MRLSAEDRAKIEAVDPAVQLTDAGGWFDGEYRETWPSFTVERYLAPDATGQGTREERDRLLADADIILGSWPFPVDLRARAPRLKWFHQRPAGASNLLRGDLWGSDVTVTTSRGSANALAIAEYAVAGILYLAKGLHRAAVDRNAGAFRSRMYRPLMLDGKTACIVGAGGIGSQVGRLCAALGMRVVGIRRHPAPDQRLPPWVHRNSRSSRPGSFPTGQRYRRHLLPMDAGNGPPVQPRPFRRYEAEQHPRQHRSGRDRR
jgi:lactate dehydrogenase-like 2-hydroxyacid dehydrogenase